jgi:hypothetical protein
MPATRPPGGGANCSDTNRCVVVTGVHASIRQSAGQLSLSSWFESSHVSPVWTVPLPQLIGNVVEEVDVLVLLLVVDEVDVVVGPALVEVVVISGALEVVVLLLVELDVLAVVDVPGLRVVVVLEDVLDVVLSVVVDDVLDVVVTEAALVLVVDEATVVEVEELVATVLVVVPFVVDVVVAGPLGPQRNAKCRPVLIVFAQAAPVTSAVEPIDSLASGLRITAPIRLSEGSFTRVPPTSTVGNGVAVSGGTAKLVPSPSTKSRATAIDVGLPGESDSTTSRPLRMLQNV